jgi:ribose transport system permease protein
LIIVIFMGIILGFSSPVFMRTQNLLNVCRQVCVSTLLSVGFTIIMGAGYMDLSVGTLMGLAGMVLAMMMKAGVPTPLAVLACIGIGILGGAMNAALITAFRLPPFVCTLATQSVFRGANYLISRLVPVVVTDSSVLFCGQGYLLGVPFPVYIMLADVLIIWMVMNKTRFGRHVLATGGNPEAARVCGISVDRMCSTARSDPTCVSLSAAPPGRYAPNTPEHSPTAYSPATDVCQCSSTHSPPFACCAHSAISSGSRARSIPCDS